MLANLNLIQDEFNFDLVLKDQLRFKPFQKGGFSRIEMSQIQKVSKKLLNELNEQPAYFIFLFCLLANRNIGTALIKDEMQDGKAISKVNVLIRRFSELYEFTKNMFLSIRELSINIIDHTEHKSGIITGRVYDTENLVSAKQNTNIDNGIGEYVNALNQRSISYNTEFKQFFDVVIFDTGKEGLINKTIKNIQKLSEGLTDEENIYTEDICLLENESILLSDFFDTSQIKLNHHAIKTASHWGLIIFSNLIRKNEGYFFASTFNKNDNGSVDFCFSSLIASSGTQISEGGENSFQTGTYYNIILPLDRKQGLNDSMPKGREAKENNFSAENYYKLLQYKDVPITYEFKKTDQNLLVYFDIASYNEDLENINYRSEIQLADTISREITKITNTNPDIIPVLNFEKCSDFFDQSRLLRFLGRFQLLHDIFDLIVINIKASNIIPLKEIIDVKDNVFDQKHFWDPNHFVLIYSYQKDENERRIYYTDLLGGYTYSDLKKLRYKLASTHQTLFDGQYTGVDPNYSAETLEGIKSSRLFRSEVSGIVQNFELILKHQNKTLFEISLENILNSNVKPKRNRSTGYKIENTHFRLGSKAHITEFVYAKRIFQNSFFSDRFAFLVAKYITEKHPDIGDTTILGYGDYSQLLINRTTEILKKVLPEPMFNNNIISDAEDFKLLKDNELLDHILILVPINTTFSTAIKIETWAQKRKDTPFIIIPVNLILVSHDDLDSKTYVASLNKYLESNDETQNNNYPYKLFNRKEINTNDRIVTVEINPPFIRNTFQKYFITIPSKWSLPEDCEKCFPILRTDQVEGIQAPAGVVFVYVLVCLPKKITLHEAYP